MPVGNIDVWEGVRVLVGRLVGEGVSVGGKVGIFVGVSEGVQVAVPAPGVGGRVAVGEEVVCGNGVGVGVGTNWEAQA